jgi:arsenate reductase-like glutaredoxin family protein
MPQKSAKFLTYGKDERCEEIRKFIERAGIRLIIRDMKTDPLSVDELRSLMGHISLTHFLNPASETYAKKGLDKGLPERDEVFRMMAEDPGLIRRPIVKTVRLITAGCDKKKISEMLQINGNEEAAESRASDRQSRVNRRAVASGK